jgi:hypothetical protein
VERLQHLQWATNVTLSPSGMNVSGRTGESSLLNLTRGATFLTLSHEMGLLDGFYYNRS